MATIEFTYSEGPEEGLPFTTHTQVKRTNVESVDDALDFLAQALRAAGFTYVERLGYADERGSIRWAPYI